MTVPSNPVCASKCEHKRGGIPLVDFRQSDHLATGAESLCDNSKVLEAGEFGAPRLVFDPRVDIERLEKEGARKAADQPAARLQGAGGASGKPEPASGRDETQEGPVLEMTKAASAKSPAEDEETALEEKQEDDERPSIH